MIGSRYGNPMPKTLRVLIVTAALLVQTGIPAPAEAACRATSDPATFDCSPTTATLQPGGVLEQNPQQSVSGRALALAASTDGQRLYAGTFSGVWRSGDQGATWRQLTRPQPSSDDNFVPGALEVPNVYDLAVSPANAEVVLAATAFDTRVRSKSGIYGSKDGGETWSLVHQFVCPGAPDAGGGNVGQVVFASDNPNLAYAAGGCAVAISRNGGRTWINSPIPNQGKAWHIAVAPQEFDPNKGAIRRVYAAGDGQLWYSEDGGSTWLQDRASLNPETGSPAPGPGSPVRFASFPDASGFSDTGGNSSQILAVEPGHPERVYAAVASISNGPAYFFAAAPPGSNCSTNGVGCGGAAVWLGDFSNFSQGQSGAWRRLASPPAYCGAGVGCNPSGFATTLSGRVYIVAYQPKTSGGYLLFLSDGAHVHVAQGVPEQSSVWHRLDGGDASQSQKLGNRLFVHADPHAIAISSDLQLTLKPASTPAPYNQNSELGAYLGGTLWMANDGGVYRSADFDPSSDSIAWKLGNGLATLQLEGPFAGLARSRIPPALYFSTRDNDDFFSLDGGATWQNNPVIDCGDCPPWFADPAQRNSALEFNRPPPTNPKLVLYVNPRANGYPDPRETWQFVSPPSIFAADPLIGYRPIVLTIAGERPLSDGDYIFIRAKPDGTRVVLRTTKIGTITSESDWVTTETEDGPTTKAFQQGPSLPAEFNVVQASGGHGFPVFYAGDMDRRYAGDPGGLKRVWKWTKGMSQWQQIVPAANGSATVAQRFFADPYDPNLIYIIDADAIKRSDDGGSSWRVDIGLNQAVTENGTFSHDVIGLPGLNEVAAVTDMVYDRREPGTRFVVGNAGVFLTVDDGASWERLLSATALPGHPVAAYFDPISDRQNRALYVGFNGRSILRISPIPGPRS